MATASQLVTVILIEPSTTTDSYSIEYTTGSVYFVATGSPAFLPYSGSSKVVVTEYGTTTIKMSPNNDICTNSVYVNVPVSYVTYSLNENGAVNGNLIVTAPIDRALNTNGTGSFTAPVSASIFFTLYNSGSSSWPVGASMNITASRDGVLFYSASTSNSGSFITGSFITATNSVYKIMATTKT